MNEETKKSPILTRARVTSELLSNIAIADITKVEIEDFAKQITLIEMSFFAAITRSEFLSLKWNGRDKHIFAPNIVASTRWFNQLNFWVQKEILKYTQVKKRTEMLSYFIRLAKRLVSLNNLYSAMSIVSALQVECVYRLQHTWAGLGQRERSAYRRLEELFGQQDNCRCLREHIKSMRLPAIPYLGLFLSDLTYTNVAHPRINGQPTTVWIKKLNSIVDAIAYFQQSRFTFCSDENIRTYLLAQSYIEELQKFLEDANYKMSLQLEPPPPACSSGVGKEGCPQETLLLRTSTPLLVESGSNSSLPGRALHSPIKAVMGGESQRRGELPPLPARSLIGYSSLNDLDGRPILSHREACKAASLPRAHVLSPGDQLSSSRSTLISTKTLSGCSDTSTSCPFHGKCCLHRAGAQATQRACVCERAVQVTSGDPSGSDYQPSSSTCLLCGCLPHGNNAAQNRPDKSDFRLLATSTPDLSAAVGLGEPPRVASEAICSAIIASLSEMALSNKDSISEPACENTGTAKGASLVGPPFSLLPGAVVMCEGVVKRKTIRRLIPPGMEALSLQPPTEASSPSPGQLLSPRMASWKLYWATLVVLQRHGTAYMLYFKAINRCPALRKDFSSTECQVHAFQGFPSESSVFASVGLARHRNGSVDDSSFLLTHPSLKKTYRLRPVCENPKSSFTGTTTPSRSPLHLFSSIRRKVSNPSTTYAEDALSSLSLPCQASLSEGGDERHLCSPLRLSRITGSRYPSTHLSDWLREMQRALDRVSQASVGL